MQNPCRLITLGIMLAAIGGGAALAQPGMRGPGPGGMGPGMIGARSRSLVPGHRCRKLP